MGRTQPKPICLYRSSPIRLGGAPGFFLCLFTERGPTNVHNILRVTVTPQMASFSWIIFCFHFPVCAPSVVLPGLCPRLSFPPVLATCPWLQLPLHPLPRFLALVSSSGPGLAIGEQLRFLGHTWLLCSRATHQSGPLVWTTLV